jgi:hypothetical protein
MVVLATAPSPMAGTALLALGVSCVAFGVAPKATKLISTYNSTEFGVSQPGTRPPKYAWLGADGVSSEPSQATGASTQSRRFRAFAAVPLGL